MRSRLSALLALPAIAGLALSGTPLCAAGRPLIWVAICGEHASRPLPLEPQRPARDRDCPVACHAACPRKQGSEAESG